MRSELMTALDNLACDQEMHSVLDIDCRRYCNLLGVMPLLQTYRSVIRWYSYERGNLSARHLDVDTITLPELAPIDENVEVVRMIGRILHIVTPCISMRRA